MTATSQASPGEGLNNSRAQGPKKSGDPFSVRGTISVVDSATVLCARRRAGSAVSYLTPEDCGGKDSPFLKMQSRGVFGEQGRITFESGWEVLLGQSEVANWLRSSPTQLKIMRYAGEWKVAGGNVDEGESVADAARRELREEFLSPLGLPLPEDAVLRPFTTKQTRAVRSRSNLMHGHLALWNENAFLRELDVEAVNRGLRARRERFFSEHAQQEKFWALSPKEREDVTPEVYQLRWVPLREAVRCALSSMTPGTFVNDFQREEFARYNRKRRDPMFITAAMLMELEGFPDAESLVQHCKSVDLEALTREEQWLFEGMDGAAVSAAFASRISSSATFTNPSFKDPGLIAELRRRRAGGGRAKL